MRLKKMVSGFKGFTLVELMVVVAIIGILAAIAVPNFRKYQAKAKTGAATLGLAALYTGEQSTFIAIDSYVACIGALLLEQPIQGYYVMGFNSGYASNPNGKAPNCLLTSSQTVSTSQGVATANLAGISATDHILIPLSMLQVGTLGVANTMFSAGTTDATSAANGTTFTAVAIGSISNIRSANGAALIDKWTINEQKSISQTSAGY